jgi:UDPglucose 6-dehydrogenase
MARKKMIVGVVGAAGYVGKGMVGLFQRAHDVVACDPVHGEGYYANAKQDSGRWDLAVLCVPTPMDTVSGACDVSIVESVFEWCRPHTGLVLVKSTVPPGTCERLSKSHGLDVHFSPEYMGEPRNFVAPWRTPDPTRPEMHGWVTVGGPRASEVLDFFTPCMSNDARYIATSSRAAEMAKYMENTYFALKVTFCNEIAKACKAFGVSYHQVRELWLADPRMHGDHTIVFPDSPGFGGKCLPKDLSALIVAAREAGVHLPLLNMVQAINNLQNCE